MRQSRANMKQSRPNIRQSWPNIRQSQPNNMQSQPSVRQSQLNIRQSQPNFRQSQPDMRQSQPIFWPWQMTTSRLNHNQTLDKTKKIIFSLSAPLHPKIGILYQLNRCFDIFGVNSLRCPSLGMGGCQSTMVSITWAVKAFARPIPLSASMALKQCLRYKILPSGLCAEICCNRGKKGLSGWIGTFSGPILEQIGTFYRYLHQN